MNDASPRPVAGVLAGVWRPIRQLLRHRVYNEYIWAYLFLLPSALIFVAFLVYPTIQSFLYSFQSFSIFTVTPEFVGLSNYQTLLADPVWWAAVRNTLIYTLATVPFTVGVALLIALLLSRFTPKLQTLFKTVFYMPGVTSAVVIGMIWLWIYYPFPEGLANYLLSLVGLPSVVWLGNPRTAMPAIIFVSWMTGQGATIVLYMAALGNVPASLYEAAEIDCATSWVRFWRITWPLIKPTTLYAALTATAGSFLIFDLVYTLTKGGPGTATITMVYRIYTIAFERFQFGLASAGAVLLAIIVIAANVIQFKYLSTDIEY